MLLDTAGASRRGAPHPHMPCASIATRSPEAAFLSRPRPSPVIRSSPLGRFSAFTTLLTRAALLSSGILLAPLHQLLQLLWSFGSRSENMDGHQSCGVVQRVKVMRRSKVKRGAVFVAERVGLSRSFSLSLPPSLSPPHPSLSLPGSGFSLEIHMTSSFWNTAQDFTGGWMSSTLLSCDVTLEGNQFPLI